MSDRIHSGCWLTTKRLRAHGVILALCLWSVYFWNIATPGLRDRGQNLKGTDLVHLYTLGSVALQHRGADLYNMDAQAELTAQRVPAANGIRYIPLYPPQVSMFLSPLARLSYSWALIVWCALSTLLYAVCCYAFSRACSGLHGAEWTVVILAAAFPGFFHLIAWGQTSAIALACFTLMFFLLRGEREFLAGLVLGCLMFKPQLGLAAAVVFIARGRWKVVFGAAASAAAQFAAAWMYYGFGPLKEWFLTMNHVSVAMPVLEPRPYQTHSLRTFWSMLIPSSGVSLALYIITAGFVLALTIMIWRSEISLDLRYSALLLATVLVAPHLIVYDLIILAPVFLLLGNWLALSPRNAVRGRLIALLYLCYFLPLVGPLARWTHVQFSVLAMFGITWIIWDLRHVPWVAADRVPAICG
jgi:hypothetical protein